MEKMRNSICIKCTACAYCRNKDNGMLACKDYNKYPRETGKEGVNNGQTI